MTTSLLSICAEIIRFLPAWGFSVMVVCIGGAAIFCCFYGIKSLYRSRMIADTPTSKLRSAAQGYIEVEGYTRMMPGEPIYAPLSGKPCVWYRYSVAQRQKSLDEDDSWVTVEGGVSEAIFNLVDQTGTCIVDPDGAEVTPSVKLCWRGNTPRPFFTPQKTGFWSRVFSTGNYQYTEHRIHEYDVLYAIGYFIGMGDCESVSLNEATRDLLALWKRDRGGLLQRFDSNRNGQIEMDEWENARREAEKEVMAGWRERPSHPEMNLLKQPSDGRPYILSSASQDEIITGNRRRALWALLGFLALGVALAWAIKQRLG